MTALTQDLSIDSEIAHVDVPLVAGEAYTIGDEVIRASHAQIQTWDDLPGLRWYISRGEDHTAPAAHSSGASLTLARKYGSGGDPGEQTVYVQPTNPALEPGWTNGAGKLWVDDTTVEPLTVRVRNAADDGWRDLLESYQGSETLLILGRPDGPVFGAELQLSPGVDPDGGGAFLSGGSSAEFGGAAQLKGGNATDHQGALIKAFGGDDQGGGAVGGGVELTAGSGPDDKIGASILMAGAGAANGSIEVIAQEIVFTLVDPPEVPASPTEQDIVDALLALGLVTQAAP